MPNFCENLGKKILAIAGLIFQIIITIIYVSNLDWVIIWQNILTLALLLLDILYSAYLHVDFDNAGNNRSINVRENAGENVNNMQHNEDQTGLIRTHQSRARENEYGQKEFNNISKNYKKK